MYEYTGPKHMPEKQELKYGIFNENNITKMQEDINELKQGGGSSGQAQADWNQTDPNAKDFIKNKPFDVTTGGQVALFDGVLDEVNTYDYPDQIWHSIDEAAFSKEDAGKTLVFTVDGHTLEAEIILLAEEGDSYYLAAQSSPTTEEQPRTYPAAEMLCQYDATEGVAFTGFYYLDDRTFVEGNSIPCKVTMDGVVTTKLDGSKVKIDNDTIKLNANNELTASGGGASPVLVVDVETATDDDTFTLSPNKTYTEVLNAFKAGKAVLARVIVPDFNDGYIEINNCVIQGPYATTTEYSENVVIAFESEIIGNAIKYTGETEMEVIDPGD